MAIKLDHYQTIVNVHWPDEDEGVPQYLVCHTKYKTLGEFGLYSQAGFGSFSGVGVPPVYPRTTGEITGADLEYYSFDGIQTHEYPTAKFLLDSLWNSAGESGLLIDDTLFAVGTVVPPATISVSGCASSTTVGSPITGPDIQWRDLGGSLITVGESVTGFRSGNVILDVLGYSLSAAGDYNESHPTPVGSTLRSAVISGNLSSKGFQNLTPSSFYYDNVLFVPIGFQVEFPVYSGLLTYPAYHLSVLAQRSE